jgi:hypothetical protein
MATRNATAVRNRVESEDRVPYGADRPAPGYSDDTAPRIRAYLARVERWDADVVGDSATYRRGRALIERMAANAKGERWPTLQLSVEQCADVLHFIDYSQPISPADWWTESDDAPSHLVGLHIILQTIEGSLRGAGRRS